MGHGRHGHSPSTRDDKRGPSEAAIRPAKDYSHAQPRPSARRFGTVFGCRIIGTCPRLQRLRWRSGESSPTCSAVPKRSFRVGRARTGLGLFAIQPIRKREYIVTYRGRRIANAEADALEARGSRYMFEINSRWTIDGS